MTKPYSEQFKQESIQYVQSHPESGVAIIAKQLGVGYSTLDSWLRHHRKSMGVAKSASMSTDQIPCGHPTINDFAVSTDL